jgi:hypothetical protein
MPPSVREFASREPLDRAKRARLTGGKIPATGGRENMAGGTFPFNCSQRVPGQPFCVLSPLEFA